MNMKTAGRPQTRSELKHQAIIDAASYEFREAGFAATSMDRIAERAGVSKRTVYNHFASKQALFDAIAERLVERVQRGGDVCYDPDQPIDALFETVGVTIVGGLLVWMIDVQERGVVLQILLTGGSGLLEQMLARWQELITMSKGLLAECPQACDTACYGCLKTFRSGTSPFLISCVTCRANSPRVARRSASFIRTALARSLPVISPRSLAREPISSSRSVLKSISSRSRSC